MYKITCRGYKLARDTSRDSDSLIQDYYECSSQDYWGSSCFNHPKVRENWRMVLAAATLLIIGIGLLATAIATFIAPQSGLQGTVFLLAGLICFIPGAYHVVYIYLAAKGRRGYHFHNLPLFTWISSIFNDNQSCIYIYIRFTLSLFLTFDVQIGWNFEIIELI